MSWKRRGARADVQQLPRAIGWVVNVTRVASVINISRVAIDTGATAALLQRDRNFRVIHEQANAHGAERARVFARR
jgi:hypothetical protein